jgi:hypothetical protein
LALKEILIYIYAPPRFSAETVSPVAAFTNGGPKKIVT